MNMNETNDFCPNENIACEIITFDYDEKNELKWKELIREKLVTAKKFEIHCWLEEVEPIIQALMHGDVKASEWKAGVIIEGAVTSKFTKMILTIPKPEVTDIYNKMTPFFTIKLDNGFCSEYYGTKVYIR